MKEEQDISTGESIGERRFDHSGFALIVCMCALYERGRGGHLKKGKYLNLCEGGLSRVNFGMKERNWRTSDLDLLVSWGPF